jgi:hypothetical protein
MFSFIKYAFSLGSYPKFNLAAYSSTSGALIDCFPDLSESKRLSSDPGDRPLDLDDYRPLDLDDDRPLDLDDDRLLDFDGVRLLDFDGVRLLDLEEPFSSTFISPKETTSFFFGYLFF